MLAVLLEVGLLCLPSIPALLWIFPAVDGTPWDDPWNALVYLYILAGVCFIGRRRMADGKPRWSWDELGVNRRGFWLSLFCGAVFIAEIPLAHIALGFPLNLRPLEPLRLAWETFFYFALVGLVEELFFRGLVYRALEDGGGRALAIFGSAFGFALWHVGWAGPFAAAHFLIGVLFALIRWRAGGIAGLVVIHGLFDLYSINIQNGLTLGTLQNMGGLTIAHPWAVAVGDVLLVGLAAALLTGGVLFKKQGQVHP